MSKKNKKKVPLTRMQRRWLLNYYCRKIMTKDEIMSKYGWTIQELSLVEERSEEHYLVKCPKCQNRSVAMYRHYNNMSVPCVSVICKDCNTRSFSSTYIGAMEKWNSGEVRMSH